jgi:hypothetical protein
MGTLLQPWQVDKLFLCPRGWAEEMANEGRLPYLRLPDGQIRFDQDEIHRVLREAKVDPAALRKEAALAN